MDDETVFEIEFENPDDDLESIARECNIQVSIVQRRSVHTVAT